MRRRSGITIAALILALSSGSSVHAQTPSSWDRLQFLVGTWDAKGPTQLGAGEGSTSFTRELNGHVIVRRSFAEYSTGPEAGTRHDDLLVIYEGTPETGPHAIYFDSEGHVIRYALTLTANGVVFQSEADPGPRYRLTYTRQGDTLNGSFEIAPPGNEFKTYLSWASSKR